jgi:putative transposase
VILEDCKAILSLVDAAVTTGARQAKACEVVGLTAKTYQRWVLKPVLGDLRLGPISAPANKFTIEEKA